MRAFKNLDYFRKVSPEHTKPTVVGGLVSILSLSVNLLSINYQIYIGHRVSVHLPNTRFFENKD